MNERILWHLLLNLSGNMQRRGQKVEHIVIVRQSTGCSGHTEITGLREHHILRSEAHFVVLIVVGHSIVEQHRQDVVVVLDFGTRWEWLVAEVSQTARQQLSRTIVGVIELLCTVVQNGRYVRVVVLIVVIERIEENTQTNPAIRGTEHLAGVVTLLGRVPEGQTVGTNAATTGNPEHNVYLPPVEVGALLGPDGTLLAAERWRYSDILRTSDGIATVLPERDGSIFLRQVGRFEGVLVLEPPVDQMGICVRRSGGEQHQQQDPSGGQEKG